MLKYSSAANTLQHISMHFSITTHIPASHSLPHARSFLHATFDSTFISFSIFSVLISSELKSAVTGPLLLAVLVSRGAHAWDWIRVSVCMMGALYHRHVYLNKINLLGKSWFNYLSLLPISLQLTQSFLVVSHRSNLFFIVIVRFSFPIITQKRNLRYVFSHVRLDEYKLWSTDAKDHLLSASRKHELISRIMLCTWAKECHNKRKNAITE